MKSLSDEPAIVMPVTLNDDKVWFDRNLKLQQMCAHTEAALQNEKNVLLLSHFASTVSQLEGLLRAREVHYERFSLFDSAELCASPPGRMWVGDARAFQAPNAFPSQKPGTPIEIIVTEHHPMRSRDQEIIDVAARLRCEVELCFYFSLDDPLMRHFGASSVQNLFQRLGIEKNECISHHLVTTAIRAAQEKIERKVQKDVPTHSVEDWFKYNLPEHT